MGDERTFSWPELAALSLGSLVATFLRIGGSPLLWQDTLNDERVVRLCLDHGFCSMAGAPVSFGKLWQGAVWHQMRAFLEWLGFGVSGAHVVLLVLDALVLVLVALIATRLAGKLAGLIAALATILLIDSMDPVAAMLWNFRPLPFLGALVLSLSVLLADRARGRTVLALLATSAAVVSTNIHMVSGTTFFCVLAACLLLPGARWRLGLLVTGSFAALLFLTSPAAWWHNLGVLLKDSWFPAQSTGGQETIVRPLVLVGTATAAALVVLLRWAEGIRRAIGVVLAATLPLLVLFLLVQSSSSLNRTDRYLISIVPAIGVGISLAVVVLGRIARKLLARAESGWSRPAVALAPYLTAVILCLVPVPSARWAGFPLPTFGDVDDILEHLGNDHHWDQATTFRSLKGPHDYLILEAMYVLDRGMAKAEDPPVALESGRAYAMKVREDLLPPDLPGSFEIVARDGDEAVLVVSGRSFLDWSAFEVCTGFDEKSRFPTGCLPTGLAVAENIGFKPVFAIKRMPDAGRQLNQAIYLRVPFDPASMPGRFVVWMPRVVDNCSGRVVTIPWGTSTVSPDGRLAEIVADSESTESSAIVMKWELGGPDCQRWTYRGFPPFFVETDAATLEALKPLVAAYEEQK